MTHKPHTTVRRIIRRGTLALLAFASCSCVQHQASTPKWERGERFERVGRFAVNGTAHQVFPLLCPVEEYKWLPGWRCTMHHSKSGVAEEDAVFETKELGCLRVTWTTITYRPDSFIEYLLVTGVDVVRLSLSLEETPEHITNVTWRMRFTTNSKLGRIVIPRAFTEEKFQRFIDDRQRQLNYYLAHGRMIPGSGEKPAVQ